MSRRRLALLAAAAVAFAAAPSVASPVHLLQPRAVVALIDSGVNPYNPAFRDRSPLAYLHPSRYLPGYPRDAVALKLSLDLPYEKAVVKDAAIWEMVDNEQLYWVPGTRFVGLIRLGSGGASCPVVGVPPATVLNQSCPERPLLDDVGHGTMTASRAGGSRSLAPGARIVAIEGLGNAGVRWAADAGWIDVQSNSWLSLVPQPLDAAAGLDTTATFAYAAKKMLTLAASGNGSAYVTGFAPTPTFVLSTAAPGVVLVGGHDNGRVTAWAGAPAHVVADAYAGWTAISTSSEIKPDPGACCTSAASPYAASGAVAIVLEARRILGDLRTGVRNGIVASGRAGIVRKGPLADGKFTLDELRNLYFHTAEARPMPGRDDGLVHWAGEPRAPDYTQYGPGANPYCQGCTTTPASWSSVPATVDAWQHLGYGAINERSVALAYDVLRGRVAEPARAAEDAHYARDQQARAALPHQ